MHNFVLLFAFLAAYAANLAFLASFSYENTIQNTDIQEIESIHSMFLSSYRNMSGSLGEWEMLWAHEPQASVSTAFLSSLKLSWVFLWLNRNMEFFSQKVLQQMVLLLSGWFCHVFIELIKNQTSSTAK